MNRPTKDLLKKITLACSGYEYDDYNRPGGELACEIEDIIEGWQKEQTILQKAKLEKDYKIMMEYMKQHNWTYEERQDWLNSPG